MHGETRTSSRTPRWRRPSRQIGRRFLSFFHAAADCTLSSSWLLTTTSARTFWASGRPRSGANSVLSPATRKFLPARSRRALPRPNWHGPRAENIKICNPMAARILHTPSGTGCVLFSGRRRRSGLLSVGSLSDWCALAGGLASDGGRRRWHVRRHNHSDGRAGGRTDQKVCWLQNYSASILQ